MINIAFLSSKTGFHDRGVLIITLASIRNPYHGWRHGPMYAAARGATSQGQTKLHRQTQCKTTIKSPLHNPRVLVSSSRTRVNADGSPGS